MGLPKQARYDLVIVGAGASGYTAALEASQRGLSVLVLEKGRTTGGSGNYMDGGFAVNSQVQRDENIHLDGQAILNKVMDYTHYRADNRTWHHFIQQSPKNIDWLLNLGVKFDGILPVGDGDHTMHMYTGRGEQVIHGTLEPQAKAAGAEVVTSVEAQHLQVNDGRVTGIIVQDFSSRDTVTIKTGAVILATGGYLNNPKLTRSISKNQHQLIPVNSGKNTGDGLTMAWEVGAQKYHLGTGQLFGGQILDDTRPSYENWQTQLNGAATQQAMLWVNQRGERFVNERTALDNFSHAGNALLTQHRVFTILDQHTVDTFIHQGLLKEMGTWSYMDDKLPDLQQELDAALARHASFITKADSVDALAQKTGLANLAATVTHYNQLAVNGVDTEFGKDPKFLLGLTSGPYYALEIGVGCFCTMGGLKVDDHNGVLDDDDLPIKGLYAAGNDASGVLVGDTYTVNMPGTQSGYNFYSGRNAAANVATYLSTSTSLA
ncbi:FAD-dependent oxidoreductase [Lactiplantibacillus garii]|uniref:FAD-dependent oxidoreductase n=1 Tax=Lactiplantibacillus garii TaxID=2306423 RepID=A0A426DAI4_9LACO|nr:FAD-dependent oxidoreductase [Lactiplantibacillus garii]RRK11638.1 FAD-dependent oxidoreductase [Lactiplantibacillus garii]